ncbi:MAG: T9SS type A sorting domain-containing protein, partial [Cytophagales bacterium]|nr:T9SS type A sorting domain-containing protein [Cytophagales bacterium]
ASSNTVYSTYAEGNKIYAGTSAGLSISSDGGSSWITTTSGQNGFASSNTVLSVYAEGNMICIGTIAGGLSASTDGGVIWTTTTAGQNGFVISNAVYSVYLEGNMIYAGTAGGLSISADGGASWTTTSGQNGFAVSNSVRSVYLEENVIYAGTTDKGLSILFPYKVLFDNLDNAADNQIQGATTNELSINNLTLDADSTTYFVRVSKDGCVQESNIALLRIVPIVTRSTPNNDEENIAVTSNIELTFSEPFTKGTGNIIIRNAADSSVVETISVVSATINDSTLIIDPSSDLDFSTTYFIEIEADIVNGQTTSNSNLAISEVLHFTTECPDLIPTALANQNGAVGGSVTFSVDAISGATYEWYSVIDMWETTTAFQNGFSSSGTIYESYTEGNMIYVGTNGGLSISSNGGASWTTTTSGQNGFSSSSVVRAVYVESNKIYAGTNGGGLSISSDGGSTWTTVTSGQNGFAISDRVISVYAEGNIIYAGTLRGLSISSDGGSSWTTTTFGQNGFAISNSINSVYSKGNKVYVGTDRGLSISSDGGASWVTTTSGQNGFATSNTVYSAYAEGNKIYAGTGGGLSISSDGGATWITTTSGQNGFAPSDRINSIHAEGNKVYVGTSKGLCISSDGGATWTIITAANQNGFPNSDFISSVDVVSNVIYASTTFGFSILRQYELLSDNVDAGADNQITGATTNELSINNLTLDANDTEYFVVVTKGDCEQTSQTAVLTVINCVPASASIITEEPEDKAVCGLTEITIPTGVSGTNLSFQWQESTGGGFTDITEGGDYTNTSSATISLNDIQSKIGNSYRLIVNNNACGYDTSQVSTIFLSTGGVSIWTGAVSTDWSECGNWSNGIVPTSTDSLQIANVENSPVITSGTISVLNLVIDEDSKFSLADGATLDVYGDMTNNSDSVQTMGTIILKGTNAQSIKGTGTYNVHNLTMNNSNGVIVDTDINVSGALVIEESTTLNTDKTITLKSTVEGTGLLVQNGDFFKNGNFVCERLINENTSFGNSAQGYRYLASPVTDATVNQLNDTQQLIITHPYSEANGGSGTRTNPFPNFFYYDESLYSSIGQSSAVSWETPTSLSNSLVIGSGYSIGTNAGTTFRVSGTPTNGSQSVTVTNTLGNDNAGYNLVGNPYPSPIDWDLVYADNSSDIGATIWLRNATSQYGGSFVTYNATSQITIPSTASYDGKIAVMQGFWVRKPTTGSASLNFENTHRITTYASEVFYKKVPKPQVLLQLTSPDEHFDEIAIYVDENATDGIEKEYDSEMFQYNSLPTPSFYSLVNGQTIKINGIGVPEQDKVIPLGMYLPKDGNFTFSINNLVTGDEELTMFLEDVQTGELLELDKNSRYNFSGKKGTLDDRFNIIIQPKTTVVTNKAQIIKEEVSIHPNPTTDQVMLSLVNAYVGDYQMNIVDAQGREVSFFAFEKTQNSISFQTTFDLPSGIYFIHLIPTEGNHTIVRKLIIR